MPFLDRWTLQKLPYFSQSSSRIIALYNKTWSEQLLLSVNQHCSSLIPLSELSADSKLIPRFFLWSCRSPFSLYRGTLLSTLYSLTSKQTLNIITYHSPHACPPNLRYSVQSYSCLCPTEVGEFSSVSRYPRMITQAHAFVASEIGRKRLTWGMYEATSTFRPSTASQYTGLTGPHL